MKEKFYQFMQGRYGNDELTRFMLVVSIALIICSWFLKGSIWTLLAFGVLIWSYVRMFSRNHQKRAAENQKYLELKNKVTGFFRGNGSSKTHRVFKCPVCKQKIRVPRGKGKISIHCPKCNNDFIRKS